MHQIFKSSSNLTISISSVVSKPIKKRCTKSIAKKRISILSEKKLNNQKAKVKIIQKDVVSQLIIDIRRIKLSSSLYLNEKKKYLENEKFFLNINKGNCDDKMKTISDLSNSSNFENSEADNKIITPVIIEVKCDESKTNYDRKVVYLNNFKSESKVYQDKTKINKNLNICKSMENLENQQSSNNSKSYFKKHLMSKKDFINSVILNFKDPFYKSLFFPNNEADNCNINSQKLRDAYQALA